MSTRTDIHRPVNLVTEDYEFVQCWDTAPPPPTSPPPPVVARFPSNTMFSSVQLAFTITIAPPRSFGGEPPGARPLRIVNPRIRAVTGSPLCRMNARPSA